MGLPYYRDVLVAVATNLSAGASEALALGGRGFPATVASVLCPSNLQTAARIKFQVAQQTANTALVDGDFKEVFVNGAIVPLVLTASTVLAVPSAIQAAMLGFSHFRVVCMSTTNVATDPADNITFRFQLSDSEDVPPVGGTGGVSTAASQTVSGDVASGATDSGSQPVKTGGVYSTAPATATAGQRREFETDSQGAQKTALTLANNSSVFMSQVSGSNTDGLSNTISTYRFLTLPKTMNGAGTWDNWRGNLEATLLASGARTTTQTGADITNYNGKGLTVVLDMTVVGTGSVTLTIQGKDAASGVYYTILSGAAVVTNVTNAYYILPGIVAAANVSANAILPRVFRIVVTANNANSATYSVGYVISN